MGAENVRNIKQVQNNPVLVYGVLSNDPTKVIPFMIDPETGRASIAAKLDIVEVRDNKAIAGGAESANDVLSESASAGTCWFFEDVLDVGGGSGQIIGAIANSESESVTPRLRLFLFSAPPTGCVLNDNVANTCPDFSDLAKLVGFIDFPAMSSLGTTDSIAVATPNTPSSNVPLPFVLGPGGTSLYGVLITRDAFTQTGTDDITIILLIERD